MLLAALLGLSTASADDLPYLFTLDLTFLVDLTSLEVLALRDEARIAAQDDSLLGRVIVYCGDPTLPVGCWAETERLGDLIADQADINRAGDLTLEFPVGDRRIGVANIAHGTPDPL